QPINNLCMAEVSLCPITERLVRMMDGKRSHADLVEGLLESLEDQDMAMVSQGKPVEDQDARRALLTESIGDHLQALANQAMLIG
ncbi:MAG: hypothetical protein N2C14_08220, partial [Planctomycetales bacterium]